MNAIFFLSLGGSAILSLLLIRAIVARARDRLCHSCGKILLTRSEMRDHHCILCSARSEDYFLPDGLHIRPARGSVEEPCAAGRPASGLRYPVNGSDPRFISSTADSTGLHE